MNTIPPIEPNSPPPTPPRPASQPAAQPQTIVVAPAKPSAFKRLLSYVGCLIFLVSLVLNIYMAVAIAAMSESEYIPNLIQKGSMNEKVVIFDVVGVLDQKASEKFSKFYLEVKNNSDIRAIVLRVSSPGGTVAASEQIHHMIEELKLAGKKVVVAMSGVAASGGYMISAPADEIFIEPTTITGSIGVIAQVPNVEGTMKKIGVKMNVYKSSHAQGWKDQMSIFRKADSRETKRLVEILDVMQEDFEKIVREGRGKRLKPRKESYTMTVRNGKKIRKVRKTDLAPFNGKIYLANEAIELGLVDKIGYVDEAADAAAQLANLSNPMIVKYISREGILKDMLFGQSSIPELPTEALNSFKTPKFMAIWKMD